MKITKKQFLSDVMHEINMLKQHATAKELSRLNFDAFNPGHSENCVYGQMTFDCESDRAKELMDVSCIRQMNLKYGFADIDNCSFSEASNFINGQYDGNTWCGSMRNWSYLSALEGYINLKDSKNKEIIAYMRGESKTLTL